MRMGMPLVTIDRRFATDGFQEYEIKKGADMSRPLGELQHGYQACCVMTYLSSYSGNRREGGEKKRRTRNFCRWRLLYC